jgi:CelD/BcsL family acetyltransferase involved in cellulose biosynthesis
MLMDLSSPLDDLRKGLAPTWRRHLNKAERAGLTITSGDTLDLFDDFVVVYNEMLARKRFPPGADILKHRRIQIVLPPDLKMGVLIARHEGRLCAGLIYSAVGDTAIYLFGATNEIALQTSAAYLLQWETTKLLRERGIRTYDLNGINPALNPGLYQFKKGLAGRHGKEITFVAQLQGYRGRLVNPSVAWLDRIRHRARISRARWQAAAGRPVLQIWRRGPVET